MIGNSGTGGPGSLSDEAYEHALAILRHAPKATEADPAGADDEDDADQAG